ncbi:MAG TPA: tetratricopeptide repeat protein [Thermotogota bacterium]|nr:tetratricopeptide repeat protein [Thermotogota bacterium]
MKTFLVYLSLKPEIAKPMNLPLRLPLLVEDFVELKESSKIPPDAILRGLRAQIKVSSAKEGTSEEASFDYYASYFLFYLYENLKAALNSKNFGEARLLLDEAESFISRFPRLVNKTDARYGFYHSLYTYHTGFPGQAETTLRKIVSENPKNPYYAMELGRLLEEQDDVDSAIEIYTKILEEAPDFLPALFSIGEIYLKTADYDRAEEQYWACIRAGADFIPPYARLGVIYNDRQQYGQAANILAQGVSRAPDDVQMHYNLSYALQRLSKPFDALSHLKIAQAQNPESILVLNELGVLYRKLGFFAESLTVLKKARSEDEENPGILWNLLWTTMLVSAEDFRELLSLSKPVLLRNSLDIDRFSPFLRSSVSHHFDLSGFLLGISDAYEEIPDYLQERIQDILANRMRTVDMDSNEDAIFLDWIVDLFENFDADPIELYRGIVLVNVALTRSTRWMAFCFSLFELVEYRAALPFDLDKTVEAVVLTAQEYDWDFASRISNIDQDCVTDWSALSDNPSPLSNLYEIFRWVLNILWIDPTTEELDSLPLEEACKRLIGYITRKMQSPLNEI